MQSTTGFSQFKSFRILKDFAALTTRRENVQMDGEIKIKERKIQMLENVTAQTGQEEQRESNGRSLIVAPTSHIVTPDEMYGLEGLDREDITLPRIKLLQAMSDEVTDSNASPGQWLNTLSGQSYGTQFEFIPISVWKSRTLFAENRDDSPLCRSADGFVSVDGHRCMTECPYNKAWEWKNGTPPPCTQGFNYLILPVDDPFPAITTLMKTSFKAGKALNTLLVAARCPAWYWVYEFYSIRESNPRGTYYVAAVRKRVEDGKPIPTDEAMRETAEAFYRMMKAGRIATERESEDFSTEAPF